MTRTFERPDNADRRDDDEVASFQKENVPDPQLGLERDAIRE